MKKQQPTMAELMVGAPSTSGNQNQNEGLTKAAAQAAAGEVFETLTKEAKDDLVGTVGWAGRVFGEQVAAALEPTVTKLAGLVAEIKVASKGTLQTNQEKPELYEGGSPAGANPGGLPAKIKSPHVKGNEANVERTATPTSNKKHPGATGWSETEPTRKALATAKTIKEQKIASPVLDGMRDEAEGEANSEKGASLADIGRKFGEMLLADLNNAGNQ